MKIKENDMKLVKDWSIGNKTFEYIKSILEKGSTVLELGSGTGTIRLTENYNVYSVEHDTKWLNKAPKSNYIHAPITNKWYDIETLKQQLPESYDLILVDGPPGYIGRYGFYNNLDLFNTNVPIIFDDVNRQAEMKLMKDVSAKLNKPFKIFKDKDNQAKNFGVII